MKISTIGPLVGLARYGAWKLQWADQDGIDEFAYISTECNPEDLLLSSKLFFPDFVMANGGVFLDHKYDESTFEIWFKQFNGDLQATEKMINHTHLYDVFDGCLVGVDDKVFEQLAEIFALSWRMLLNKNFPDKRFAVDASNSDKDYGPIITFYQIFDQVEK
jgi:hypothetical protein